MYTLNKYILYQDYKELFLSFQMVWVETPTNPTMQLVDIEAVVNVVRGEKKDIFVVVDNTFMSSCMQVLNLYFFILIVIPLIARCTRYNFI
jgi:cystathionine beta-lyase/cystathionine gamma-synthase